MQLLPFTYLYLWNDKWFWFDEWQTTRKYTTGLVFIFSWFMMFCCGCFEEFTRPMKHLCCAVCIHYHLHIAILSMSYRKVCLPCLSQTCDNRNNKPTAFLANKYTLFSLYLFLHIQHTAKLTCAKYSLIDNITCQLSKVVYKSDIYGK